MALKYKSTWKGFRPRQLDNSRRSTLRQQGKKGKENQKANREKKQEHLRLQITSCELRISPHCTPFDNLTWAHSLKRREMGKWGSAEREFNMQESVLGCVHCHRILDEEMTHEEMGTTVKRVITDRPNKLTETA